MMIKFTEILKNDNYELYFKYVMSNENFKAFNDMTNLHKRLNSGELSTRELFGGFASVFESISGDNPKSEPMLNICKTLSNGDIPDVLRGMFDGIKNQLDQVLSKPNTPSRSASEGGTSVENVPIVSVDEIYQPNTIPADRIYNPNTPSGSASEGGNSAHSIWMS